MSRAVGEASAAATPADCDFSTLTILLLQGVLHREADERLWDALLKLQRRVQDYVGVLGLEVVLDPAEGYAFLASPADVARSLAAPRPPSLLAQRALPFHASVLLALLRRRLAEFDARGGESRLVLGREDIVAMLRPYLSAATSEAGLAEAIQVHVDRVVALGFLRRLDPSSGSARYEVQRILKGFVDPSWLTELERRLSHLAAQSVDAATPQDSAR